MNFNYRKLIGAGSAALLLSVFAPATANAAPLTITAGSQRDNAGGEFLITGGTDNFAINIAANYADGARNANATGFFTFCLEGNEFITLPGSYDYAVSSGALNGGINTDSGDPVSAGAGYLYGLFARGQLSLYDYDAGNGSGYAGDLQNAIWWLEGEGGSLTAAYAALLASEFGSAAIAALDVAVPSTSLGRNVTASDYGVAAINMGPVADNYPNQDQLVYLGGGFQVPDGGTTVALLGLSLGGLGFLRRKLAR